MKMIATFGLATVSLVAASVVASASMTPASLQMTHVEAQSQISAPVVLVGNSPTTPRTRLVREEGSIAIDPLLDPALHTRSGRR